MLIDLAVSIFMQTKAISFFSNRLTAVRCRPTPPDRRTIYRSDRVRICVRPRTIAMPNDVYEFVYEFTTKVGHSTVRPFVHNFVHNRTLFFPQGNTAFRSTALKKLARLSNSNISPNYFKIPILVNFGVLITNPVKFERSAAIREKSASEVAISPYASGSM
jgi:hypothetical protein